MKIKLDHLIIAAGCFIMLSCKKDNYEQPSSMLTGKLVYKGESLGLGQNEVPYQLYQYGFGKAPHFALNLDFLLYKQAYL